MPITRLGSLSGWRAGNLKISDGILEREAHYYEADGGDSVTFTGKKNKSYFVLERNRLIKAKTQTSPMNKISQLNEYKFDSCGKKRPVTLQSAGFLGLKGKSSHKDGRAVNDEGLVALSVDDTMLGDLTGDGVDEGLAIITCNWGGTGDFAFLVVFDLAGKQPVKLADLDEQFSDDDYRTEKAEIRDEKIFVTYVHQPGKAYPLGARRTQAYVIRNGKFIRDAGKPKTQTVKKAGFTFSVPADWIIAQEDGSAIHMAPAGSISRIDGKPDITFGLGAGVMNVKKNTAKSLFNSILEVPVFKTKSLDEAARSFIKMMEKQSGYRQVGLTQKVLLDSKPAIRGKLEGISKASRKPETLIINVAIITSGKLFYLISTSPIGIKPAETRVFDEAVNSLHIL